MQKNPLHLPGNGKNEVHPKIVSFFERFPAASHAYAPTRLFHFTHGINLLGIQSRGLQPFHRPFPLEHGEFLLKVATQSGGDTDYIRDCIVDQKGTHLTKNFDETDYSVPRRLALLCRGLHACIRNQEVAAKDQAFAAEAFELHRTRLLENRPKTFIFQVNALAPAVLNARLSRMSLETVDSTDYAVMLAENCDGTGAINVRIGGSIPQIYLTDMGHVPFNTTAALVQLTAPAPWMTQPQ